MVRANESDYQLVLLEAYHRYKNMKLSFLRTKEKDRRFDNLMALYRIAKDWHSFQNPVGSGARKVDAVLYDIEHMFD